MQHGMSATKFEPTRGVTERRKRLVPWDSRPTILVVEDDEEMRAMVAAFLRSDGYRVIEAQDGEGAFEWLGPGVLEGQLDRIPSLIISDIRLPFLSGFEILEGIRLAELWVPVILITGFGDVQTHALAEELGAERVLDKPFDLAELRAAVRELC